MSLCHLGLEASEVQCNKVTHVQDRSDTLSSSPGDLNPGGTPACGPNPVPYLCIPPHEYHLTILQGSLHTVFSCTSCLCCAQLLMPQQVLHLDFQAEPSRHGEDWGTWRCFADAPWQNGKHHQHRETTLEITSTEKRILNATHAVKTDFDLYLVLNWVLFKCSSLLIKNIFWRKKSILFAKRVGRSVWLQQMIRSGLYNK